MLHHGMKIRKSKHLAKHIKLVYEPEFYLKRLPESLRIDIAKFRTSNHRMPFQRGHYDGTSREERLFRLCND